MAPQIPRVNFFFFWLLYFSVATEPHEWSVATEILYCDRTLSQCARARSPALGADHARGRARWAVAVSQHDLTLSRARTSTMRTKAMSCALPGDPVATRTPGRDREPIYSFTLTRLVALEVWSRALQHAQCVCRARCPARASVGRVRDRARREACCRDPRLKIFVVTEIVLLQQRTRILCRDREPEMGSSPFFLFSLHFQFFFFMYFLKSYCLYKIYSDSNEM